jgi:hypothetical protein
MRKIIINKKLCAIIYNDRDIKIKKGVNFLTLPSFNLQIGTMSHKKNHEIKPHLHKDFLRKIYKTTEILIINSGELKVNFYDKKLKFVKSTVLKKNNIALLIEGAHGFKVKKNCNFIEIKQGPFLINNDKKLI